VPCVKDFQLKKKISPEANLTRLTPYSSEVHNQRSLCSHLVVVEDLPLVSQKFDF